MIIILYSFTVVDRHTEILIIILSSQTAEQQMMLISQKNVKNFYMGYRYVSYRNTVYDIGMMMHYYKFFFFCLLAIV